MKVLNFIKRVVGMPLLLCLIAALGIAMFSLSVWLLGLVLHAMGVPYFARNHTVNDRALNLGLLAVYIVSIVALITFGFVNFCKWIRQQWRES